MRHDLLSLVFAGLCGCQIVYKLPTRQGNVYDQKDLQKIQLGMTREQVHFVLGTPIATSPFREDRWDYVGYYKSPRGQVITRTMLLEKVWDYHFAPQTNVIDVHISRLRSKIDKPFPRALLHTVRGAGYRLQA